MPDASLAEKLKNWRLLSEGLKLRIEEVPFLKEDHAELSAEVRNQIAIAAHAAADGAEAVAFRAGGRGAGELALAPLVGLGRLVGLGGR